MALAITAPVPVTHSGEVDPALTPQSEVGVPLADIVGTMTTSAGVAKVRISAAESGVPDVTVSVTATLLAFTTAGILSYIPQALGMYTVSVTDVTAGTTVTTTIEVFSSEGV